MAHVLANDLRAAVLQAAIQGKLTSKDKNDSLINETQKEYQIPFADGYDLELDIPDYWRFCTIQNVCETIKAGGDKPKTFSKEKTKNNSIPVIANGETNNGVIGYTDEAVIFQKSLTVSGRGTIGFSVIRDTPYYPIVRLLVLIPKQFINIKYLKIAMTALLETGVGTAVKQLTKPMISQKVIPLPPIEEQQRIVDRVDELMAKIDEYEKLENQLVQLKEQFPKDMRDSLLQAAIQGKLTKQLKNDTSVEEILKSIEEQKKTLIKEDKLQKKKSFHLIRNDEIPFDIPDNWVFAKLGYISTYDEEKQKINARDANDNLWMLDLEDIAKGGTLLCKKRVFERKAIGDKTIFEKGSILYSKLRPYLLKILIADEDGICTPELVPFKMYGGINTSYIALFLKSPYVDSEINKVTYGVKMPRVGTKTMVNFYVPLPPIEEQQRIVDKLDEMLPLVDALAQMD